MDWGGGREREAKRQDCRPSPIPPPPPPPAILTDPKPDLVDRLLTDDALAPSRIASARAASAAAAAAARSPGDTGSPEAQVAAPDRPHHGAVGPLDDSQEGSCLVEGVGGRAGDAAQAFKVPAAV